LIARDVVASTKLVDCRSRVDAPLCIGFSQASLVKTKFARREGSGRGTAAPMQLVVSGLQSLMRRFVELLRVKGCFGKRGRERKHGRLSERVPVTLPEFVFAILYVALPTRTP